MLRFGNTFLEPLMNRQHVASVTISFKEVMQCCVRLMECSVRLMPVLRVPDGVLRAPDASAALELRPCVIDCTAGFRNRWSRGLL